MYRKRRPRARGGTLDLDFLMDVLTCLVGVMLFLVIYTVLELSSTSYEALVPVSPAPAEGSRMVVVVAQERTARVMDVNRALAGLLTGIDIVRPADLPIFVDQANLNPETDGFFTYSLERRDGPVSSTDPVQSLELRVEPRLGVVGDSVHQLVSSSTFAASLDRLDPERARLVFTVDTMSVDVFRRARQMAAERGFAIDWRPATLDFPLIHGLTGRTADEVLLGVADGSKPIR
jgi:hypothetical protein